MRICLVSREYPPFFGGGIGTYSVQFSRTLAAAGHQVVVLTVAGGGEHERESDGQITIVRLPFIRGQDWSRPHPAIDTPQHRAAFTTFAPVSLLAMQVARALPQLQEEFRFDVVEFPDTGALGWFVLNDRRTAGDWADGGPAIISCIHSPSDWIAHHNRRPPRERAEHELIAMEQDSMRWSDGLVCPSFAVGRWVEEHCHLTTGAVDVIHHSLGDLEEVARASVDRPPAPAPEEGGRRILFAGRLEPRKGIDTLLAGFALAVERGADLHLDLAGQDTPSPDGRGQFGRQSLHRLVPPELHPRITFHGKLAPARVTELQRTADAIAVPAPMDNFPYTCMEAMAHGRAVIAARAGGMEQMVGSEPAAPDPGSHLEAQGAVGLLFEPSNVESCAETLLRVATMSPEELEALGRRAAQRIVDVCANQMVLARRIRHYEQAIAARTASVAARKARARRGVVMVNAEGLGSEAGKRFQGAVSLPPPHGCDFVHGWVRLPSGEVVASSTPRLPMPEPRLCNLGPLALAAEAAEHSAVAPLLSPGPDPQHAVTKDTQKLLIALREAGFQGGVIPQIVTPVDAPRRLRRGTPLPLQALRGLVRRLRGFAANIQAPPGEGASSEYHARETARTDSGPPATEGGTARPRPRMID